MQSDLIPRAFEVLDQFVNVGHEAFLCNAVDGSAREFILAMNRHRTGSNLTNLGLMLVNAENVKDFYLSGRRFSVPEGGEGDNIEASFEKDVLTVSLPKTAEQQRRRSLSRLIESNTAF